MTRTALLVCSPGGHLLQMLALEPSWSHLETTWATLPAPDVEHLLADREVVLAHGPTNRHLGNLVRNAWVAWRVIRRVRPDVILSTGAALAIPFFFVGRFYGCRRIYVESLTRTEGLSLSGRLVYPLSDVFFVQWPRAGRGRSRAVHAGSLL